jgi:hypothetical protein
MLLIDDGSIEAWIRPEILRCAQDDSWVYVVSDAVIVVELGGGGAGAEAADGFGFGVVDAEDG